MEITIDYNRQSVSVEVTVEVYEYLDRADHKEENLSHERRRHWDEREFDEYIAFTEGVGVYSETPEEYLCRKETLDELLSVLARCTDTQVAIEAAIREHYRDNRLDSKAAEQVIEAFGLERTMYVLANTVQQKDWDGRFSPRNKEWAKTIPIHANPDAWRADRNCQFVVDSHPGLTDIFLETVRREHCQQKEAGKSARPSVRAKLQSTPHKNSPKISANLKG